MYIFVFMWTPTLDQFVTHYSHGIVFACFMVCVMIGSSIFKIASSTTSIEDILVYGFVASIIALSTTFVDVSIDIV